MEDRIRRVCSILSRSPGMELDEYLQDTSRRPGFD